jgi:hypothetical protein
LGDWQSIVSLLQSWVDQWAALLSGVPEGTAFAAILLPVVLAIFSGRILVVLACTIIALIALCTFVAPANTAMVLATGAYSGSLVLALSGIVRRQEAAAVHADLAKLRTDFAKLQQHVDHLLAANDRRFLSELRASTEERSAGISTIPAAGDSSPQATR